VMDKDVLILPAELSFDEFLRVQGQGKEAALRHVVVTRGDRVLGVLRVNTGLRRGLAGADTGVTLGDVASKNFTIVREGDIAFDVIERMYRRHAIMAVVLKAQGQPKPDNVLGIITKEHVADSVANSVKVYSN
ncbi:MAG TPA: CBS domain-containing protein, partial [Rhizomicrobium sp.]|nr:CBS domain-containing protein [Rhizomicrobium sp.]